MRCKAAIGFVALVVCAVLARAADDAGFTSLFDGKSLDGWVGVNTDRFTVRDGVIVNAGGTGWLRSVKAYRNFEFQTEYRVVRAGSDSGIFFRATSESAPKAPGWPLKCYQLQIIDGDSLLMLFGHGAACMFDRNSDALKSSRKAQGEWQSLTLKVVGSRAEAWLNGTLITVSDTISLPEGHIGLQGENGHLEWRGLKIKELPPG
ncbi:MAG: DUF1080 domain-containing protein [Isosphaeraceae bacterium]